MPTNEQREREVYATITIAIIAGVLLTLSMGVEGIMTFLLNKFLLLVGNVFLIVTLIDVLKGGIDKDKYADYVMFVIIGLVFMGVYAMLSSQTVFTMVTSSLQYILYVVVIAGIVKYLKREI